MTAVVGILNKKAVAIAADSAATSSNGKIFNKANKVFALSKMHPIGLIIHNSDSFMNTPWEVIIKMYRNKLGDTCFDTLEEYKKDFIAYLVGEKFFSSDDHQLLNCIGFFQALMIGL